MKAVFFNSQELLPELEHFFSLSELLDIQESQPLSPLFFGVFLLYLDYKNILRTSQETGPTSFADGPGFC